jgi:hypothetical protein
VPHLTVAASEAVFAKTLELVVDAVAFEPAGSHDFGAFRAGYDGRLVLAGGDVELRSDATIRLHELDARWEKLELTLVLELPQLQIGGGCFDGPLGGVVCLPAVTLFRGSPRVAVTVDLAPFVRHELTLVGTPRVDYFDPATSPFTERCQQVHTALDIDDTKTQWRVYCDPQTIDFDPFDLADTAGDLLVDAFSAAIEALLPPGLGVIRDAVFAAIGSIGDLVRTLLDIPDDIAEWLSDLFNVSFGLFNLVLQFVADFFGRCVSFYQLDDPYPVFPATDTLLAVSVPIEDLQATVDDLELVVTANVGE